MNSYDDIAACAASYTDARDALQGDPEDLARYEAVLRSRVAFADCLLASGWRAPEDLVELLKMDRELLAQPRGAIEPG